MFKPSAADDNFAEELLVYDPPALDGLIAATVCCAFISLVSLFANAIRKLAHSCWHAGGHARLRYEMWRHEQADECVKVEVKGLEEGRAGQPSLRPPDKTLLDATLGTSKSKSCQKPTKQQDKALSGRRPSVDLVSEQALPEPVAEERALKRKMSAIQAWAKPEEVEEEIGIKLTLKDLAQPEIVAQQMAPIVEALPPNVRSLSKGHSKSSRSSQRSTPSSTPRRDSKGRSPRPVTDEPVQGFDWHQKRLRDEKFMTNSSQSSAEQGRGRQGGRRAQDWWSLKQPLPIKAPHPVDSLRSTAASSKESVPDRGRSTRSSKETAASSQDEDLEEALPGRASQRLSKKAGDPHQMYEGSGQREYEGSPERERALER